MDTSKIGPDDIRVGKGGNSPLKRMKDHPDHYQSMLANIIRENRIGLMVETGVESGYSTEHFLVAMDENRHGQLISCDPAPSKFYNLYPIEHSRFTLMREKSFDALPKIYSKHGMIDLFLHDSDHSWECQTWEYEWAWKHVRSGGIIASDDIGWGVSTVNGTISHDAWRRFCERHGVAASVVKINNAEYFRKP